MDTPHDSATAASTTEGLPVAPSLGPAIEQLHLPHATEENRARIVYISLLAIAAAGADTFVAGSAIFHAGDYRAEIAAMRRAIG